MTEPAVVVEHLHKRFGDFDAVRDVSFEVPTGQTFGLLGPTGAGKTTTFSMLRTLLRPTSGRAEVAGAAMVREREKVRGRIGLVFPGSRRPRRCPCPSTRRPG